MRAGHVFLASFAASPLAGWPLLAHASYRRFSPVCRVVLSSAAGAVFVSFWMTVFALMGLPWRILLLVLFAAATSCLVRLSLKGETPTERVPAVEPASSLGEKLAILLAALAVLWAFLAAASGAATSTDLLIFWGPKAQAFASARTIDSRFLGDPFLDYLHPSYPPLLTNLYAFATMAAGRFAWGAVVLTFPMLLAALALGLPGVLRLASPRPIVLACSALVVSALGFLGSAVYVAGNGDMPLLLFETLATAVLIGPSALTRSGQLLGGLLLAGAAATKVEGLPFLAATGLLFLALRGREIRIRSSLLFLFSPAALSLGTWLAFGAARRLFIGYRGYGRFSEVHWNRLLPVVAAVGKALWSAGFALPFLLPLLALLAAPGKSRLVLLPIGVSLALSLFFIFTYLHGDQDPHQWIGWSAVRIFSPLVALLAIGSLTRSRPKRLGTAGLDPEGARA